MADNKNSFVSLNENIKSQITLADGRCQDVEGKGIIAVKTKDGLSIFINDVLYVLGLAKNLLSMGQLIWNNYMIKFDDNKCFILPPIY